MNSSLLVNCAVLSLLCISRLVSSGKDDYDPCKAAGFVSGDIAVSKEELKFIRRTRRAATSLVRKHWKHGIIPYEIDTVFTGDQKATILGAMRHWENNSCLTFVEHTDEVDYIFFHQGSCGCCSFVGREGNGKQGISIGKNCDRHGIIVHELGHAVGFWHEHTRPDSNEHVKILKDNIKKAEEHNFRKKVKSEVESFGEPYDFGSIMHYALNTFSKGIKYNTIEPLDPSLPKLIFSNIGQRRQLSKSDIRQVNKMYRCPKCGGTFQEPFGSFSSPGYPGITKKTYTCEWRISVNPGEVIVLTTKKLDLRKSNHCRTDFVEIRDGHSKSSKLIGRYCGNNIPKEITSSDSRLWILSEIKGHSNSSLFKGFYFNYKAACGGTLKQKKGEIQSPNFPMEYQFNKECTWKIIVEKGTKVGIKFSSFDIEHYSNCIYDSLSIYDGPNVHYPMLKRLCGNVIPDNVMSSSNEMVIKFQSDNSVAKKGFMLNFISEVDECLDNNGGCEQICRNTLGHYECDCKTGYELHSNGKNCEVACGGVLKGRNGTITSPSYPDKYPENKKCIWTIRAPPLHQIKLSFQDFEVENSGGCQYDYLEVKSTINSTRLCGDKIPDVMMSTSNEMDLEFCSDNSMSLKGFALKYYTDKDECLENNAGCQHKCVNVVGGYECRCRSGYKLKDKHRCVEEPGSRHIRESSTGVITSPNYPQQYDSNLDLTWNIIVLHGHRIKLTFKEIDVEYNAACDFDYVEVHSGISPSSEVLRRVCGGNASSIPPLISKSNKMQVKFHTDTFQTMTGFKAVYETVCGGRFHADDFIQLIISHADYDGKPYKPNTRCEWHLAAKSGYAIKIKFKKFELEQEKGCTYDFVKITDGSDSSAPLLDKICGSQPGKEYVSTGNNIWLQFHTDSDEGKQGFYVEYKRVKLENHSAG